MERPKHDWNGRIKVFRFRLSTMLILLTLIAFAIHFWIDWPRRAAESFVDKQYRDRVEIVNPFQEGSNEYMEFEQNKKPRLIQQERERIARLKLVPHQRSMADTCWGRQTFDFGMEEFTICRGKVVSGPTPFFDSVIRFYR